MQVKSTVRPGIFLLIIALVFIAGSIWFYKNSGLFTKKIRNVILISIDTCRADYLSCYGYPRKTTPNIDSIAAEGIIFENVVTPYPLTLPGHSSMFTGTIPLSHGVYNNGYDGLAQSNITLAEIVKKNGFATAAIIGSFVLKSQFGLNQGFDTYNDKFDNEFNTVGYTERSAGEVSEHAISWLEKHSDESLFLFLHYFDPHLQWNPPEPFISDFSENLYAGEIAYVDYCIGEVVNALKRLDLYNSTLLIITSDHGESIAEHGENTHGYFIYQSTVRVPLVIKIPGQTKGLKVSDAAGLVDIVPTICGLLDIQAPTKIQGRDLTPYFSGNNETREDADYYIESLVPTNYNCSPLRGIVNGDWKYIYTNRPELYNISEDPQETYNQIDEQPQHRSILEKKLKEIVEKTTRKDIRHSKTDLDEESKVLLESLGYVGRVKSDTSFELDHRKKDPKDLIQFHVLYTGANLYHFQDNKIKTEETCKRMLDIYPEFPATYYLLGRTAHKNNDLEKAKHYYAKYIELNPNDYEIFQNLGRILLYLGDYDDAVKNFQKALQLKPDLAELHFDIGHLLQLNGKYDEAIKRYRQTIKLKPDFAQAYYELGIILQSRREQEEAISLYNQTLKIEPDHINAHHNLARIYFRNDKFNMAENHYKEVLKTEADNIAAHLGLANTLYELKKIKQALDQYYRVLKSAPDYTVVLKTLAWILATTKDSSIANHTDAVRFGKRACELTDYKQAEYLDTLAAAYASANDFPQAVRTAEKALQLAESSNNIDLAEKIKNRLVRYQSSQPYYEPS